MVCRSYQTVLKSVVCFDVSLTVHLSIIIATEQLNAQVLVL